jgi:hypothetical protein
MLLKNNKTNNLISNNNKPNNLISKINSINNKDLYYNTNNSGIRKINKSKSKAFNNYKVFNNS